MITVSQVAILFSVSVRAIVFSLIPFYIWSKRRWLFCYNIVFFTYVAQFMREAEPVGVVHIVLFITFYLQ